MLLVAERDDVREGIVLKILLVHFQQIFIIAKNVLDCLWLSSIGGDHSQKPLFDSGLVLKFERRVLGMKGNGRQSDLVHIEHHLYYSAFVQEQ